MSSNNSDQLNSEIRELLVDLKDFYLHIDDGAYLVANYPNQTSLGILEETTAAIQTLINKARKDELGGVQLEYGGRFQATTYITGEAQTIQDRIAELSTQEENNE